MGRFSSFVRRVLEALTYDPMKPETLWVLLLFAMLCVVLLVAVLGWYIEHTLPRLEFK